MVVREHYNAVSPDETLRNCKPRPARRPVTSSADVASVIADFGEYGDDCAAKLGATWKSIDEAKAQAERLNSSTPK